MHLRRALSGMALASLFALAPAARAQSEPGSPPTPPPPPELPAPAPAPAPAPVQDPTVGPVPVAPAPAPVVAVPAGAAPARSTPEEGVRDGVRLRGGFSVAGGVFLLPANPVGGAASISGRIGVQFNHYFGLYYQNTPIVGATVAHDKRSGTVVAGDFNSLLVNLTLFHMLEIGAGPSLDLLAIAKGSISTMGANAESGKGLVAGGHGRVAFNVGGLSGNGPRRSGFVIGADAHPLFLSTGAALSLTIGVGAEWY